MRVSVCVVAASVSLAGGCASIVNGTTQVVSVEAHQNEQRVEGARCEMVNSKGTYHVSTPGTAIINRAYGDLSVRCDKDGLPTGSATVSSATKGMVFGNALFGGLIGVAVDTTSGAAYDYPELIRVAMGESLVINGRDGTTEPDPAVSTRAAAPSVPAPAGVGATTVSSLAPGGGAATWPASASSQKPASMEDLRYLLPSR